MKITVKGNAQEIAALVNEINGGDTIKIDEIEIEEDEILTAFKKMTLARIRRLETSAGQDHCELNAVRRCVELIAAFEFGDDDSACAAI